MLTLLSELKFWTSLPENVPAQITHSTLKRGNDLEKKPQRLKRNLKKLELKLKQHKLVNCEWVSSNIVQIMLSNGLLAYLVIHPCTSELTQIAFDKYFVGKLVSEDVHNVIMSKMHILISYNENQITFVYLQKPNMRSNVPVKVHNMEPKVFHFVIGGNLRKTPRHLSTNMSFDLLAVWTKGSQMEVYPWRPTTKDQERANLHVYKLSRTKLELLSYYWTEFDPICIEFSKQNENQLHSIEQKITRKGIVSVESCIYQLAKSRLHRVSTTSIPLQTQTCCCAFSPDHEKIMIGSIDGSIILFDAGRGITHLVKASFIPQFVSWHCDSALLMISNERCQLQAFDISLSCVKNQLLSDEIIPSPVLDLAPVSGTQLINLTKMRFSKKPDLLTHHEKYAQDDTHLILCFGTGSLACLRIIGGAGHKNDIHKTGFTADVLVYNYIGLGQVEKAINILLSLNWDAYGAMCLVSLHKIANFIFKQSLTPERENQLQKALGSFHVPVKPLSDETVKEFGDQVDDITRRFFYYMIRYESFEKAFSLAIDINDADLFMDLYKIVKDQDLDDLAKAALKKAEEIYKQIEEDENKSDTSHSTCSNSSCSICFSGSDECSSSDDEVESVKDTQEKSPTYANKSKISRNNSALNYSRQRPSKQQNRNSRSVHYMPPLPLTKSTLAQKIQIPKPEIRTKSASSNQLNNKNLDNPLYENRASVDTVDTNKLSYSMENLDFINRPPKPTPRTLTSKLVDDGTHNIMQNAISNRGSTRQLDQTIGIPIASEPSLGIPTYSMLQPQNTKAYFSMHGFNNEFSYKPVFPVAPPIIHNHPLIAGNIPPIVPLPPASAMKSPEKTLNGNKKEVNSILAGSSSGGGSTGANNSKKDGGEKNKVKFSDTITIAVVPEMPRKDKNAPLERLKKIGPHAYTNPKKELAESLPLCHPNEDYLKDFNLLPSDRASEKHDDINGNNGIKESNKKAAPSVKVVHFGLV